MAGLLALVVCAGCKKKEAGGPPPNAPVQVVLIIAKRQPIAETLALVGSLAANEMIQIKAEAEGVIAEIPFQEGQAVKKGDLLVRLDESKWVAGLAEAEANLKISETTFERNKQLLRDKLISQQEYDQSAAIFHGHHATVELRKRMLQDARVLAPFAGVVGSRQVSPGQVIAKDATLTWLVDASIIKAEFDVPERFMGDLKLGQQIDLEVAAFPKEKFRGEVYFIAPQLDPGTRTVLVKARVPNQEYKLRPGMFANLDLTVTTRESSVVIPETAIVRIMQEDRATVFTVTETNTVAVTPVKLGIRLPGQVEVIEGLRGGERVIVEGVQKVGPGSRVVAAASVSPNNKSSTSVPTNSRANPPVSRSSGNSE